MKSYYYELFWYTDRDHENWSSQGYDNLKEALQAYENFKNQYFDVEVTKRKASNGELIRYVR